MQLPIQLDHDSSLSLQTQIFDRIRALILNGDLGSAARLPSSRELSTQLQVSRNTVNIVYERLNAEGYIETRPGKGTFVTSEIPELTQLPRTTSKKSCSTSYAPKYDGTFNADKPTLFYDGDDRLSIDFRVGRPDPAMFPIKVWRKLANKYLCEDRHELTTYNDPGGLLQLRKALQVHLRKTRGIQVDAQQILIVAGVQEALNLICRVLISPGAEVAIESPTYQGAAYTFSSYGARLLPIRVEEQGLDIERLPHQGARLVYVTPSHQFPLGYTLSLQRRLLLLEWAKRTRSYIVEDDYDSDFRYHSSPLTALHGLDNHQRVIYTSTFSKSLGAGIRLGYVVVPEHLLEPTLTAKALLNNGHPWLEQKVLSEFIENGTFENHLRKLRKACLKRRDKLIESITKYFPNSRFSGLEGGMHVVWYLPDNLPNARELQKLMRNNGIGIYSLTLGHAYDFGDLNNRDRIILLGYTALSEANIAHGIHRIYELSKR